jgi:hypothetical protein
MTWIASLIVIPGFRYSAIQKSSLLQGEAGRGSGKIILGNLPTPSLARGLISNQLGCGIHYLRFLVDMHSLFIYTEHRFT